MGTADVSGTAVPSILDAEVGLLVVGVEVGSATEAAGFVCEAYDNPETSAFVLGMAQGFVEFHTFALSMAMSHPLVEAPRRVVPCCVPENSTISLRAAIW